MALISKSIPSLFNGVSQQPAPLRGPSQCETSINAYPALSTGLRKRPPTQHIAKLTSTTDTDAYVAVYNYSTDDKYIIILRDEAIDVYHEDGTACTVTATPFTAWAATTAYSLADVRIPTTPNGFQYRVTVAGTSAGSEPTWPTTLGGTVVDGTVTWECVPNYLNATIARQDFGHTVFGEYVLILNKNVILTERADVVAGALTSTVQTFGALPAATGSGNIHEVAGDNTNNFDNYYVKDTAAGVWSEWLKPGEVYRLDECTLPYRLTRTGKYTFTFDLNTWDDRAVGDRTTVQPLSILGHAIADIFLYRNRLGFIAGENVVLSKSGANNYFNFFPGQATAVLADDPVDLTTASNKKTVLRYAVPFNTALIMFSDQTQYQLTGGDVFSPQTARIDPITEFESDPNCKPVALGQEIYFSVPRTTNAAIRNYFIDTEALTNDASDITAHVPNYLPANVFKLTASSTEDLVFALTLEERNAIYLYKFYWQEDKKVQAAWQKFTWDAGDTILNAEFLNNICYMVVQRTDGVFLEKLDMQPDATDTDVGFLVHLDRKDSLTAVYTAGTDTNEWTLPYDDNGDFSIVIPDTFSGRKGEVIQCTRPGAANKVQVIGQGDLSAGDVYVGRRYTMTYTFSEIWYKDQNGLPVLGGALALKNMVVNFSNTGYFRVEVTPFARSTYSYVFNGQVLGTSFTTIGEPSLASGAFRFPILSRNVGTVISIINDKPVPSNLQSAEWTGDFTLKSRRQG